LGGMLLHVIDAPGPIDLPVHGAQGNRRGGVMNYLFLSIGVRRDGLVDNFHYARIAEFAEVVRLPA
jgi:hypothetical protein